MARGNRALYCALVLTSAPLAGLLAAKAEPVAAKPADAEHRIQRALDQPLKEPLTFVDIPFNTITAQIAEQYEIPIQFDQKAIEAAAASPDQEITANLRNISLRSALDIIVTHIPDLAYVIDHEVLWITTEDEVQKRMVARVYPVDDLLVESDEMEIIGDSDRVTDFVDVLVASIAPDSWQARGMGDGRIQWCEPGLLVVYQSRPNLEKIEALLHDMRAAKREVEANQGQAADNQFITRGYRISAGDVDLDVIRDAIMKSVNWETPGEKLAQEPSLQVTKNLVWVRHKPSVARQVGKTLRSLSLLPDRSNGPFAGGRIVGSGSGSGN